ncbi:MAG TPA: hypothetical protein P5168_01335 [Candidatus Methanomethylicus sp.]|nr:hypothetical protein [Candidatus Methanomethylicus sp.]
MDKRAIALVALLAAVYAVVGLLPGLPILGAPGSEIDLVRSLEPAYGVLLGPVLGPVAAFFGAAIGKLASGDAVGLLFAPLALIPAFIAAALYRRKIAGVPGWAIASGVLSLLILGWYLLPEGVAVCYYAAPHIAALSILLTFRGRISGMLASESKKRLALGLLLSGFPATMAGNMLGNIIFIVAFSPSPLFFAPLLPVMLGERLLITFLSATIGTPLILAAKRLIGRRHVGDAV